MDPTGVFPLPLFFFKRPPPAPIFLVCCLFCFSSFFGFPRVILIVSCLEHGCISSRVFLTPPPPLLFALGNCLLGDGLKFLCLWPCALSLNSPLTVHVFVFPPFVHSVMMFLLNFFLRVWFVYRSPFLVY